MHKSDECYSCDLDADKHCEHCGVGYCEDCGDMSLEPIILDGNDTSQLCINCYDKVIT